VDATETIKLINSLRRILHKTM